MAAGVNGVAGQDVDRELDNIWREIRDHLRVKLDAASQFVFHAEKELVRQNGLITILFGQDQETRDALSARIDEVRAQLEATRQAVRDIESTLKAAARINGAISGILVAVATQVAIALVKHFFSLP